MTPDDPRWPRRPRGEALIGRAAECRKLDELLQDVHRGASRALVVHGEAGVGKSALLDYVVEQAGSARVLRVVGVPSEAEIAVAGLHQLCAPLLDRLASIPSPQQDALAAAFGLRAGPAPDRFVLGLAALSLLGEAARDRPLVCVVDDAQWLDLTSLQALAFVARRLVAESVAMVFALREGTGGQWLAGLPQLRVRGLAPGDARRLVDGAIAGPLDERVCDRIVLETRGNPLALLELPRGLSHVELAGGFGLLDAQTLTDRIEASFRRRLATLPADARRLVLLAAVESTGDPELVERAAGRLGITADTADPAAFAGLLRWGTPITFRHPLARSAVYRAAPAPERRQVHRALADVIDPAADGDRRAWHLAQSVRGADEEVAGELERSAGRARDRGGLAAAAAFLERAVRLTPAGPKRVGRALAAAEAELQIGAFDDARRLLQVAERGPLTDLQRARSELLRAELAFSSSRGNEAAPLLLAAARRLESLDPRLARDTYLDAIAAATFAGRLAGSSDAGQVAAAARAAPRPRPPDIVDRLLTALAVRFTEGYAAAVPLARRTVRAFATDDVGPEALRWFWLAGAVAADQWDDEGWQVVAARFVRTARRSGALTDLPLALNSRAVVDVFTGDLQLAAAQVDEARAVMETIGTGLAPYGAVWLSAWRGNEDEARPLIDATLAEVAARGEGVGLTVTHAASAVLSNALGQYERAADDAGQAAEATDELAALGWGLAELVEAAARLGDRGRAAHALDRLSAMTRASGTEWARGVEARSRALIAADDVAEPLYREAVDRLSRTRVRTELARARLVYGEWLRRRRRRLDAREHLRSAHDTFSTMGADAFADRARRELLATGETVHKRTGTITTELTAQQWQIARLAGKGLSNPEIAAQLFLSPRTVEWHLSKIFVKLGISSRHELDRVV